MSRRPKFYDCGVKMEKSLTPDQCAKMRAFLRVVQEAGKHQEKVNIGRLMVEYKNATLGHVRRHNCEPCPKFWTKERKQQARELHDSGLTWKQVGKIIGVSGPAAQQMGGAYRYV